MPQSMPGILRIRQLAVPVKDLDRAIGFYRDVLGLPLLFTAPPGLAFFDVGGVRLMLSRPEGRDTGRASIAYYLVEDIHAAMSALEERGARIQSPAHKVAAMPDHDLWMGFIADSEDNLLGIVSEVPRA